MKVYRDNLFSFCSKLYVSSYNVAYFLSTTGLPAPQITRLNFLVCFVPELSSTTNDHVLSITPYFVLNSISFLSLNLIIEPS